MVNEDLSGSWLKTIWLSNHLDPEILTDVKSVIKTFKQAGTELGKAQPEQGLRLTRVILGPTELQYGLLMGSKAAMRWLHEKLFFRLVQNLNSSG